MASSLAYRLRERVLVSDNKKKVTTLKLDQFFTKNSCSVDSNISKNLDSVISLTNESQYEQAFSLLQESNPLPCAYAYVNDDCQKQELISQFRSIYEILFDKLLSQKFEPDQPTQTTGKRVAVIGSGPAGMVCTYFLARAGHSVTIFEKNKQLGGMLRYGIPEFRLAKKYLDFDLSAILSYNNVNTQLGVKIGTDVKFTDLNDQFDATYIAVGAQCGKILNISGSDSKEVFSAIDVLRKTAEHNALDFKNKNVVVIGGGNVAMDAIRTALRLNAKSVTCAYRSKSANQIEYDAASAEGCKFLSMLSPLGIISDKNKNVKAISLKRQKIDEFGHFVADDSAPIILKADVVIMAIGQAVESEYFKSQGVTLNSGIISQKSGIFAAGDCVTGPRTVLDATNSAMNSAKTINEYLQS